MPPLNSYFSNLGENYSNTNEQDLVSDLMKEAIDIMGVNGYYISRTDENLDDLFGEDTNAQFNTSNLMSMYIENIDSFDGTDKLMTEYGIAFQDQVEFRVARTEYEGIIGAGQEPVEGDIIYMPLSENLFQIVKVRKENQFFPTDTLPSFLLLCEEYIYSNENIATTITEIDDVTINDLVEADTATEIGDNESIQTDADTIIDFTEDNPFGNY